MHYKISWFVLGVWLVAGAAVADVLGDDETATLPSVSADAEHLASKFSVAASIRWQRGKAKELVYAGPFKISELTWDIQDLAYVGLTLRVALGARWALEASHWEAVTAGSGGMTNYDFLIPGFPEWTDFSDGPVDMNRAYMSDIRMIWAAWEQKQTQFQLQGGYRQSHWDWSQYGGDFVYSVNGFRDFVGSFPSRENGINYEQTFHIPYFGVGVQANRRMLEFSGYLQYSPFAWADAFDEHVLRELFFEDTFRGIDYFGAGASVIYPLGERWYLSGAWDWHNIPEARGNTVIIDAVDGSTESFRNAAGIANRAWSLGLSAGMRF